MISRNAYIAALFGGGVPAPASSAASALTAWEIVVRRNVALAATRTKSK